MEPLIDSHDHEYDGEPTKGRVAFCVDRRCTHTVVGTGTAWREPTPSERTAITLRQWEDLIVFDTMRMVHGDERGKRRAQYLLGYTDAE